MTRNAMERFNWAPVLPLVLMASLVLAACQEAPVTPTTPIPSKPTEPEKASTRCDVDVAIRLTDRGQGIHAAIKDSTLYIGGTTASAECASRSGTGADAQTATLEPASAGRITYTLIVVRYPLNTRLYILRRQTDGTTCIVDLEDTCVASVTELPSGFNVTDLPDDVPVTLPASREPDAPETPEMPPANLPNVAGYYVGTATYTPAADAPDSRPWTMGGAVTITQSGARVTVSGEWVDHQGNTEPIGPNTCTIDASGRCADVVFSNGRITQEITHSDGAITRINLAKAAPGTAPRPIPPSTPSSPPASVPYVAGYYEGTLSGIFDGETGSVAVAARVSQNVALVGGSYRITRQGQTTPWTTLSFTCVIDAYGRCNTGVPVITITFSSNSVTVYMRGSDGNVSADGGGTLSRRGRPILPSRRGAD